MLEKVKAALRITNPAFDEEAADIIDACKADLAMAGIVNIGDNDPLIIRAVILYAKANMGFSEDSEKFARAYAFHKCALKMAGDYNGKVE